MPSATTMVSSDDRYILQTCDDCGHEWLAYRNNDGEPCPACEIMDYAVLRALCDECGGKRLVLTRRDGNPGRVWVNDREQWERYTSREEDRVRCVRCNEWTCVLHEDGEPLQVEG